jgi:hypothetical protein
MRGMKTEQKVVGIGAASGVVSMLLGMWILTAIVPESKIMDTTANRLAYALAANMLAILPFFVMMVNVGNRRFLSRAIDPTKHVEDSSMEIDGRVTDNTLQQTFVFFVASLALSTVLPFTHLHVIWAAAIWFVIARIAFWVGYRMHPLLRAPGMSATAYLNLGIICYVLYMLS